MLSRIAISLVVAFMDIYRQYTYMIIDPNIFMARLLILSKPRSEMSRVGEDLQDGVKLAAVVPRAPSYESGG